MQVLGQMLEATSCPGQAGLPLPLLAPDLPLPGSIFVAVGAILERDLIHKIAHRR